MSFFISSHSCKISGHFLNAFHSQFMCLYSLFILMLIATFHYVLNYFVICLWNFISRCILFYISWGFSFQGVFHVVILFNVIWEEKKYFTYHV